MASRSSSDHPESSHPYHVDRSQSTASLESQGKKRSTGGFLGRFLPKSRKETLLPLPEGASLSSSSPPQLLPLSPLQSIHLPQPATDTTGITVGDSTWAATYESPPLPPMTILGTPILQHPQPQLAQASSGIMSPFHSVPISQRPATTHSSTEECRQSGASLYRSTTGNSTHASLYQQSRNPSPVPHASQSPTVTTAVTGQMRSSSAQDVELEFTAGIGHESPDSSAQSHSLHRSYSRPLSRDTMSISLTRQQEKAPSRNTPADPTHQSQQSPIREQFPSRPPSRRSRQATPALPVMTLPEAIKFYQRTATDLSIAIPEELRRAEYRELLNIMLMSYPSF